MPGQNVLAQWQYVLPNAILTLAIYLMLVRLLMSLAFEATSSSWVWRVTRRLSDPIVATVGYITPRIVPDRLVPVFVIAWLVAARILLRLAFMLSAARPRLGVM
jgi:hypothetical protein